MLRGLADGWSSPWPRRQIAVGQWASLSPIAELPHPLLAKAAEQFGSDPAQDVHYDVIASSGQLQLEEVRCGQWRAGVWTDADGVRWIVAAGLSKGNHQDNDDFYEVLKARVANKRAPSLLPSDDDIRLLKRETAAAAVLRAELALQQVTADLLAVALTTGTASMDVPALRGRDQFMRVQLSWATLAGPDYTCEELVVQFNDIQRPGSDEYWLLATRVLTSLAPPVQDWDASSNSSFSTMCDRGVTAQRLTRLNECVATDVLLPAEPGAVSHFTHERHIARASVEGDGLRALCGVFFVPTQDPASKDPCPECTRVHSTLPSVTS